MPVASAFLEAASSWSVASISTSTLIVSIGAPLSRSTSPRPALSPPAICGCSVRVIWSGLYWKMMTPACGPVALAATSAPLSVRGAPGNQLAISDLPRGVGAARLRYRALAHLLDVDRGRGPLDVVHARHLEARLRVVFDRRAHAELGVEREAPPGEVPDLLPFDREAERARLCG